jgi:hypothetical protein
VYVPEDVKRKIVLLPDVVTVGEPVVTPVYSVVFMDRYTTPPTPAPVACPPPP